MPYIQAPRYVTWLYQQSLAYDPENEKWEKRLSRYFLFFLRINGKQRMAIRRVEELFQATSLPLDWQNPKRSRQRLEKALTRLQMDRQIASWEYLSASITQLPVKQWLPLWLRWKVRITALAPDVRVVPGA